MEKQRRTCAECGGSLPRGGAGRPRSYCSTDCRRAAEFAVRRDQSLVVRAQRKLQDAQLKLAMADSGWDSKPAQKAVTFWEGEVERLRGEIRTKIRFSTDFEKTSESPHA